MYQLRTAAVLTAAILLTACGDPAQEQSSVNPEPENTDGPALSVSASVGVELGDSNFVFGVIQDVDFTPDGNLAVLDSQKKRVRVFSPEGDFLGSFGGQGEAPGEFLNPRSMACLADGRIAVSDPFSREVEIFEPDFTHSETVSDFSERAPFVITSTESGFAGEQGGFNREMGTMSVRVIEWDLEADSQTVYYEQEQNFTPESLVNRFMQPQSGIASGNGFIYYSPPAEDRYEVRIFSPDGSSTETLTFSGYTPHEKSHEDIQAEIQMFEDRMQAMASSGRGGRLAEAGYDPPENYYATASLGIDQNSTVWVQRGWEENPVFDLFPIGEGEPSATVSVSGDIDLSGYSFVVSPYGIAAYHPDPEDYPRVYILKVN